MKTIIFITAKRAILIFTLFSGFQIQLLMAESPEKNRPVKNTLDLSALASGTPKEAAFNDAIPAKAPSMVSLIFVVPNEATFDDENSSPEISTELLREVAPVTPAEADFEDSSIDNVQDTTTVKFYVPLEANFIDS